jgi:regulator of replication initiation timing
MSDKVELTTEIGTPASEPVSVVEETVRLQLQNVHLRQQLLREQINGLVLQFLQTSQPRALQQQLEAAIQEGQTLIVATFAAAGLKPEDYRLDLATGRFTPNQQLREQATAAMRKD